MVPLHLKYLKWPLEGHWDSWEYEHAALEGSLGARTQTCLVSTEVMIVG